MNVTDCKGTIYVAHHRLFWSYKSSLFQPVHAGRKTATLINPLEIQPNFTPPDPSMPSDIGHDIPASLYYECMKVNDMPGDDTGDHISEKNSTYSEMTVIYWAWKNRPREDFIGFYHYRRYFDTLLSRKVKKNYYISEIELLGKKISPTQFISEQNICNLMRKYDVLLPYKYFWSGESLAEKYKKHFPFFDIVMKALLEEHPKQSDVIYRTFHVVRGGYMQNRFIMREHVFQEYANFVFPILFKIEKIMPRTERIFGYISEFLLNLFLEMKKEKLKIKELPSILIKDL